MRWVLLAGLDAMGLWLMMLSFGIANAWARGERPRWWFPRRRFRRLVLSHAPTLAQWERTIALDPFGADPFRGENGT